VQRRTALAVVVLLGTALVLADRGIRVLPVSARQTVRLVYFLILLLAALWPARFLASLFGREKEAGRAAFLVLAPFPRPEFLRSVAWQALSWGFGALLALGAIQLWAFSHMARWRWFDAWGLPALCWLAPAGVFWASAGLSLWAGVRMRTVASALAVAGGLACTFALVFVGGAILLARVVRPPDLSAATAAVACAVVGQAVGRAAFRAAAREFDDGMIGGG
jgi:hypothetical protein